MLLSRNWVAKFAGRVLVSALIGGFFTAIVGALCGATAGALFGWILDIRSTPPSWDGEFLLPGAWLVAYLGSFSGFVGLFAGAVAAFDGKPASSIVPRALLRNLALGQLFGTGGAVSSYLLFAVAVAVAQFSGDPFVGIVEDNLELVIWGAPILMICGAVAGAIFRRD